jgi:putative two-component system response regulator
MEIDRSLIVKGADILVVDDTIENLTLLTKMLKDSGYAVRPVPNGKLALQAAANKKPDLILLDITMPEMDGYEVCQKLKADPNVSDVPVLFISALSQTDEKVKAFEVGGIDYITKPFQYDEVKARVDAHLNLYRLQTQLEEVVRDQVREIYDQQMGMIFGLAKLAEIRDTDTGKHLERIRELCRLFASELHTLPKYQNHVDNDYVVRIFQASPLHDVGKVGIPDHILLKPGKLTPEEFEIMKTHTVIGAKTLMDVRQRFPNNQFVKMGIKIALSHHERWDGKGYPEGLLGDNIPLSARIMTIVDVYDAVRSKRVYKPPVSHEETCKIILAGAGSQFDPELVNIFASLRPRFQEIWEDLQD